MSRETSEQQPLLGRQRRSWLSRLFCCCNRCWDSDHEIVQPIIPQRQQRRSTRFAIHLRYICQCRCCWGEHSDNEDNDYDGVSEDNGQPQPQATVDSAIGKEPSPSPEATPPPPPPPQPQRPPPVWLTRPRPAPFFRPASDSEWMIRPTEKRDDRIESAGATFDLSKFTEAPSSSGLGSSQPETRITPGSTQSFGTFGSGFLSPESYGNRSITPTIPGSSKPQGPFVPGSAIPVPYVSAGLDKSGHSARSEKPVLAIPGSAKLESTKPESTKPESTKPESAKPESAKPESAKPGSAKPGSAKPEPELALALALPGPTVPGPVPIPGMAFPAIHFGNVNSPTYVPPEFLAILHQHNYRIGRKLGSGGFSMIYEVWKEIAPPEGGGQPQTIHAVAKFIQHSASKREYIENEIKICRCVVHRFIVRTIDTMQTIYVTVLMHEYALDDLFGYLRKAPQLETEQRFQWMAEMTDALMYLHRNGVAHCDLKPENVLMVEHPQVGILAKLYDFGLSVVTQWTMRYASLVSQGYDRDHIRRTMQELRQRGFFLDEPRGTIVYMAPEALLLNHMGTSAGGGQGETRYDPFKADIFSLAVTFYFTTFEHLPGQPEWYCRERAEHYRELESNTDWYQVKRECQQVAGPVFANLMESMFSMHPDWRPIPEEILRSSIFSESPAVQRIFQTIPHLKPYIDLFS